MMMKPTFAPLADRTQQARHHMNTTRGQASLLAKAPAAAVGSSARLAAVAPPPLLGQPLLPSPTAHVLSPVVTSFYSPTRSAMVATLASAPGVAAVRVNDPYAFNAVTNWRLSPVAGSSANSSLVLQPASANGSLLDASNESLGSVRSLPLAVPTPSTPLAVMAGASPTTAAATTTVTHTAIRRVYLNGRPVPVLASGEPMFPTAGVSSDDE